MIQTYRSVRCPAAGRWILLCMLLVTRCGFAADTGATGDALIYSRFREYRMSLSELDANPSIYFSRSWNLFNLGLLIKKRTSDDALDELRVIRKRFRLGAVVDFVHKYQVTATGAGTRTLLVVGSSRADSKQRPTEIRYVLEDGSWQIAEVFYDLPGKMPLPTTIDSFPSVDY